MILSMVDTTAGEAVTAMVAIPGSYMKFNRGKMGMKILYVLMKLGRGSLQNTAVNRSS